MKHELRITIVFVLGLVMGFIPGKLMAQHLPDLNIEKFVLSNGMNVILKEDHRMPNVVIGLTFHSGSTCEKPGQTGYAHLLEHMMFQGTNNMQGDYFSNISVFGGQAGGSTSKDFTRYFDTVPANYLERAL
jgi:zinc protease